MRMNFLPPPPDAAIASHTIVVVLIVIAATVLRGLHDLDTATLSTVYGAALGFAAGQTMRPTSSGR